ncbi:restriction endonuclease subunit S, partial [Acinetobacter variabilis]
VMTAPKLRFDGFDSDWTLDSIGAVISNKSKKYDPEKSEIDFPCIELEHLSQQTGEILGTVSAKDQKSIKNVFDENSVLFGKLRPYLRKFAKPKFQGVCSSEIWVLTSKKMQPNFLFQYVQTDGFSELTQIQAGS